MKQVQLEAKVRNERGTTKSRILRQTGWVPAELYGRKEENKSLVVPNKELGRILHGAGGESLFFNLAIDASEPILAVLREVQYHPVDHAILHADFQKVRMDEKVRVKIPVRVQNIELCEGVKAGGTLQLFKRSLEVFCLPNQVPDGVAVDVTNMQIEQSLHVSGLKLPEGIQVTDPAGSVVLSIAAPMAEEVVAVAAPVAGAEGAAAPVAGAEGAPAEPEVLTAKKKEEGAAAEGKGKEGAKEKAPTKK